LGSASQHDTAHAARTQQLAGAARAATAAAADHAGGGIALLFVCSPDLSASDEMPQLRAAAGFGSAGAAKQAAASIAVQAQDARLASGISAFAPDPTLGERAAAGVVMHPLVCEGRVHGVLAVGSPQPLDPTRRALIEQLVEVLALRFDHCHMAEGFVVVDQRVGAAERGTEEKSEEILKLSEALFAQDIELLRSNERLGKIEKLKTDFIERMSRELRTPLNSIIEAIISVLTNENDAISEGAKQSLRNALDDGTGFLRTLQNILDLWRVKQGELQIEHQDVNFRETVDEAIFSVQDAASQKPLTIEQQLDERFPKIRTDLTKINQIVFLLLENAVKFTPSGKITIRSWIEEDRLHCAVADTGIGIAADDREAVFDEFFQVDEGSSARYSGSGLGLALVRDLIILLDGDIQLESEIGHGTTITFSLPVHIVG
jgi:signal transduction histidine kinase